MKLSKDDIKHIATLARLELTDDEIEKYGSELSAILDFVDQLKEVDVTGVEPTAQVTGMENVYRHDEAKPWDEAESEEALDQTPDREGKSVKVKRVLE
jgi:aspartyl-tRNA(Asn)/glutamyl-tRNA(Gln) amidotransferase subunit C